MKVFADLRTLFTNISCKSFLCKEVPTKRSQDDGLKQNYQRTYTSNSPVWIEKYPYLSTRSATSSSLEERSRSDIDYVHGTIKCKIHGSKGARKKGANMDRDDDAGGCDRKNPLRRHRAGHCGCRHRRQRRRRLGKMLEKTSGVKSGAPLKKEVETETKTTTREAPF